MSTKKPPTETELAGGFGSARYLRANYFLAAFFFGAAFLTPLAGAAFFAAAFLAMFFLKQLMIPQNLIAPQQAIHMVAHHDIFLRARKERSREFLTSFPHFSSSVLDSVRHDFVSRHSSKLYRRRTVVK